MLSTMDGKASVVGAKELGRVRLTPDNPKRQLWHWRNRMVVHLLTFEALVAITYAFGVKMPFNEPRYSERCDHPRAQSADFNR
jgi:hypothetical protein